MSFRPARRSSQPDARIRRIRTVDRGYWPSTTIATVALCYLTLKKGLPGEKERLMSAREHEGQLAKDRQENGKAVEAANGTARRLANGAERARKIARDAQRGLARDVPAKK